MSDELKKTLPRIRTFAADFEHDRKESGLPVPDGVTVPTAVISQPLEVASLPTEDSPPYDDESTISINAQVPAFHELKKRTSSDYVTTPVQAVKGEMKPLHEPAPVARHQAKTVVVRNTKPTSTQKPVATGGATIITDNKRSGQSFIPALIESIRAWFKTRSADSKQKRVPKYTVVETERRKGVIQKATTKTGTIFTADNETLKDEIRRRSWEKSVSEPEQPEISWSPNTEVGYPLLDSGLPKPTNVAIAFKKRSEPTPIATPVAPPPPAPVMPPPVFVEPTVPEPVLPPAPAVVVEEELEPKYVLTTPEAHYRIRSIGDVTKLNTNILSLGVVGVIAGIIVVIIVGRALFGFVFSNDRSEAIVPATPIALGTSVTDLTLDVLTKEALVIALQQIPADKRVQQEFRIVDTNGVPLQNSLLLPLIGFANTGSLYQTISEVHIVYTQGTQGIIFTVTDATTAFGSLLAWESSMVESLGPILTVNRPVDTLDVSDRTIANTDVRIFTTGNQEVLVYGFVGANKVLITKDVPSFTAALGSQ